MRFEIVQGNEQLFSQSGLALVGEILRCTGVRKRLDAVGLPEHRCSKISHGEVATAMIGLMCLGKPDFDAIEPFRDDPFFTQSLCLQSVLSGPTLRQRLDGANGAFIGSYPLEGTVPGSRLGIEYTFDSCQHDLFARTT